MRRSYLIETFLKSRHSKAIQLAHEREMIYEFLCHIEDAIERCHAVEFFNLYNMKRIQSRCSDYHSIIIITKSSVYVPVEIFEEAALNAYSNYRHISKIIKEMQRNTGADCIIRSTKERYVVAWDYDNDVCGDVGRVNRNQNSCFAVQDNMIEYIIFNRKLFDEDLIEHRKMFEDLLHIYESAKG